MGAIKSIRKHRILWYWYGPDSTFADLNPVQVIFPEHRPKDWARGDYRTGSAKGYVGKLGSTRMRITAPQVRAFVQKMEVDEDQTLELIAAVGGASLPMDERWRNAAQGCCEWLKARRLDDLVTRSHWLYWGIWHRRRSRHASYVSGWSSKLPDLPRRNLLRALWRWWVHLSLPALQPRLPSNQGWTDQLHTLRSGHTFSWSRSGNLLTLQQRQFHELEHSNKLLSLRAFRSLDNKQSLGSRGARKVDRNWRRGGMMPCYLVFCWRNFITHTHICNRVWLRYWCRSHIRRPLSLCPRTVPVRGPLWSLHGRVFLPRFRGLARSPWLLFQP